MGVIDFAMLARKLAPLCWLATLAGAGGPAAAASVLEPMLFAEANFEPDKSYVHAQSVYRIRFFQAVSFNDLEIKLPRMPLADVRQIGGDRFEEVKRGEMRYRVTERRYAVFPFASGELRVENVQLSGKDVTGGSARSVRVNVPPALLVVRPMPDHFTPKAWLPARDLRLTELWSAGAETTRIGESLRRTLRIEAVGVDAARIVEPALAGDGFSAHPEPPRLSNRFEKGWNIGVREQTWRIVPSREGTLALPPIRIDWWDVVDGVARTTTLPERTLGVGGGSTTAASNGKAELSSSREPPPSDEGVPGAQNAWGSIASLAVAGVVLCLIATAAGIRWWRHTAAWRAVKTACRRNDARAARTALLDWARQSAPAAPPRSLGELEQCLVGEGARAAVRTLDRCLYGPPGDAWAGRQLLLAMAGQPAIASRANTQ
jgi:hypothetical protein